MDDQPSIDVTRHHVDPKVTDLIGDGDVKVKFRLCMAGVTRDVEIDLTFGAPVKYKGGV